MEKFPKINSVILIHFKWRVFCPPGLFLIFWPNASLWFDGMIHCSPLRLKSLFLEKKLNRVAFKGLAGRVPSAHSTLKNHQKWHKFRKKMKKSLVQLAFQPITQSHFQNPKPNFWKPAPSLFTNQHTQTKNVFLKNIIVWKKIFYLKSDSQDDLHLMNASSYHWLMKAQ